MRKITLMMAALIMAVVAMADGMTSNVAVGMSGTYKVGTTEVAPDFTSLGAAVTALNTSGVSGDVTLLITSDLTEAAAIGLSTNTGAYTITIKPSSGLTPTITLVGTATAGATQYSGFTLNGTSNVIIDGSNTTSGTTKDLTLKMNDATNGRNIIQLYGNCDNVTIKNVNISYQAPMSTSASTRGVYLNGQSTGACDNFTLQNCSIGDLTNTPYYAAGVTGSSGSLIYCTNINIKDNLLYGRIRPVYLYYVGTTGTTSEISGNSIYTRGGANGTTTYTIMWNTWAGTLNIKNNNIPELTVANTSGTSGVYGISGLAAATGSVVNMYNNYIGGINASLGSGVPSVFSLMYIQDAATYYIYNNTFVYQNMVNATERSNIHISGNGCNVNLKNNLILNYTDAANAYCIWKSNGTLISNYNDLYISGASANIGYVGGAAKQTLSAWQTGFTPNNDLNSKSVNVNFSSSFSGDFSLTGASIDDYNLAVPRQANVTTDIAGTNRAALTYAGAYEASDLTAVAKQFTVNVPAGTAKAYIAGGFTGKNWDIADPYSLIPTGTANQFSAILPCVDGVEYKYICEKADWDYQEAIIDGVNVNVGVNRTYNATDNVPAWYRVNKVTLNAGFAAGSAVPTTLFVKGAFNAWASPIEMTKSGSTFSTVIGGNAGDKIAPNTEYKYYTNDEVADNWESLADGSFMGNRWMIAPVMTDEVARFTTWLSTEVNGVETTARIMRTNSGIEIALDGLSTIELYTLNGIMIDKMITAGAYVRDLANGIYIVRINGKATKFIK